VKAAGMTLLEVMVALAVFAVAGLALVKSAGEQVGGLGHLEQRTFANWVADNQMAERRLEGKWPGLSWVNGKEEMAGHTWYWRWQGVQTADDSFRALDVEVRADEKDASPLVTLRSYVNK